MFFSAEILHSLEISRMVMNYKIRHIKNWPERDSLVWPDHFVPLLIFVVAEKWKTWSGHARLRARVAMEEGLLSVWVILARALVNHSWSMKIIATFSTRDLQEQCCKSYVASYWANEVCDLVNVFSQTTSMKVIHESFLPWTIPNV